MHSLGNTHYGFEVVEKGGCRPLVKQVHGTLILEAGHQYPAPEADGLFTRKPHEQVFVLTADCAPLLFISQGMVGAVHAGWRGARGGIIRRAIELFDNDPHVILGPCIHPCCYEVQEDFLSPDIEPFIARREEKIFFDLPGYTRNELRSLPAERLNFTHTRCTHCSSPELPSFRRERNRNRSIRSWIYFT